MIFSIDHGNEQVKTPHFVFKSGLNRASGFEAPGEHGTLFAGEELLDWNGATYWLSNNRIPYTRDKTVDSTFLILTLFALGKEFERIGKDNFSGDIHIACGLPVEHYFLGNQRKKTEEYFLKQGKNLRFQYKGHWHTVRIKKVSVYPQGFAAAISQIDKISEYGRALIIDIGGYTTDVILLHKGKLLDISQCWTFDEAGVIHLCNKIDKAVKGRFDQKIVDSQIYEILNEKEDTTVFSREIKKEVLRIAGEYAGYILRSLREHGYDVKSNPAYLTGGGAALFKPFFERMDLPKHIKYILDVKANAIGYYKLAELGI